MIGTIAASILYITIPADEGTEYRAYRDIAGVWTICNGDTKNVRANMVETPEGCRRRLEKQLIVHAKPMMECVPQLKASGRDYQRAAITSLAYNNGVTNICGSTAAKRFRAADWVGGCNAFLSWKNIKVSISQVARYRKSGESCFKSKNGHWYCSVRGLRLRRERERQVCLTNLIPGYTPANLHQRIERYMP
ncbi:lysozyme [Sphingopyxis indica]|uniref:lysozyme n=1 Tax=Sphingopyxis indica TaxID=436663 RepID=UPI002938EB34|nr:lysozyme [Sphingopyxis indica]WOF44384.1 lysozyme [Sphingopyxis indica]